MFFNEYYIEYFAGSDGIGEAISIFKTSLDLRSAGLTTAVCGSVLYLITLSAMLIDRLS